MRSRTAHRERTTKETSINVSIDVDGTGRTSVDTGLPFFDHMLDQLGRHGGFDLEVSAKGDLHVADGATCRAVVEAGRVTVDGMVEGNVTARERVELTAKAKMKGDLIASRLLVAEGASFTGHVTVGTDAAKSGKFPEGPSTMAEAKPGAGMPARPEPARR